MFEWGWGGRVHGARVSQIVVQTVGVTGGVFLSRRLAMPANHGALSIPPDDKSERIRCPTSVGCVAAEDLERETRGAESVVDVHDGNSRTAAGKHRVERDHSALSNAGPD